MRNSTSEDAVLTPEEKTAANSQFFKPSHEGVPLIERAPFTMVAIGDPHGHWRYVAAVLRGFYAAAGYWPDAIIDVGDRGYYPEEHMMDKASRKHAAKDPEQADGLRRILASGDPLFEDLMDGAPPIDGIGGNHEGHVALAGWMKERPQGAHVAIDPKGRLRMIRNGTVAHYKGSTGIDVRVGALWGIEPTGKRTTQRAVGKHIDVEAVARLRKARFDILVSHDGPESSAIISGMTVGSPDISRLLGQSPRTLGLFGHYHHREGREIHLGGESLAIQLGIARVGVPTAFAVVRGQPGEWTVDPWASIREWKAKANECIVSLPPQSRPTGDDHQWNIKDLSHGTGRCFINQSKPA